MMLNPQERRLNDNIVTRAPGTQPPYPFQLLGWSLLNLVRGLFISLANGLIIGGSHPQ